MYWFSFGGKLTKTISSILSDVCCKIFSQHWCVESKNYVFWFYLIFLFICVFSSSYTGLLGAVDVQWTKHKQCKRLKSHRLGEKILNCLFHWKITLQMCIENSNWKGWLTYKFEQFKLITTRKEKCSTFSNKLSCTMFLS